MNPTKDIFCVVMAGGNGSRLWPLSQPAKPKQFLDLMGVGRTMLQLTYDRFRRICAPDRFVIVTLADFRPYVLEQLPEVPPENIVCEPFRRNTAACVAVGAAFVKQKNASASVIVTPADHLILNEERFCATVADAARYAAEADTLITVGIRAIRPDTAFGYIQAGEVVSRYGATDIRAVRTFTEKPGADMAQVFLDCGDFCWNSGVFCWNVGAIEGALRRFVPSMATLFDTLDSIPPTHWTTDALRTVYEQCENTSVDYGVLEKASNVSVCMADVVWNDLGSWTAIYDQSAKDDDGNAAIGGQTVVRGSHNCIVRTDPGRVVVVEGLDDYLVAQHAETTLICPRASSPSAWNYLSEIKTERD